MVSFRFDYSFKLQHCNDRIIDMSNVDDIESTFESINRTWNGHQWVAINTNAAIYQSSDPRVEWQLRGYCRKKSEQICKYSARVAPYSNGLAFSMRIVPKWNWCIARVWCRRYCCCCLRLHTLWPTFPMWAKRRAPSTSPACSQWPIWSIWRICTINR